MATTKDYMEFIMDQLAELNFEFRYRKMFGEYCVYANDKPILLVCENTVFVKIVPYLETIMQEAPVSEAYPGSKNYYILDIEDSALVKPVIELLEHHSLVPVKRKRASKSSKMPKRTPNN